jgi:lipid II:glycine glycyltransferase (peptidoglycan interpeptide bridge formation enzyme)
MTNVTWLDGLPDDEWDKTQSNLQAHFLQSAAWAAFQIAQGKKVFRASDEDWSWLAILETSKLGKYLYCPYGPTVKSAEELAKALAVLKSCAKQQKVDFIRIEPRGPLTEKDLRGLKLQSAHHEMQPRYTLIKDLARPDDDLWAEMSSTNRRLARRAKESGFSFQTSQKPEDIAPFLDMIQETAQRHGVRFFSSEYYRTMVNTLLPRGAARIFYVIYEGKPVAGCLTFEDADTRYYAHAASAESARKLQPGVPLLGHVIFDAKNAGKKQIDYCGIAPPNQPDHKLAGVTRFKESFGGEVKATLGTWELPMRIVRYHSYRLVRKIRP